MAAMTVKNVHCVRTCDLVQNYDGYHRGLFMGIVRLRPKGFNLSRGGEMTEEVPIYKRWDYVERLYIRFMGKKPTLNIL